LLQVLNDLGRTLNLNEYRTGRIPREKTARVVRRVRKYVGVLKGCVGQVRKYGAGQRRLAGLPWPGNCDNRIFTALFLHDVGEMAMNHAPL